jgi:hypothetical protein
MSENDIVTKNLVLDRQRKTQNAKLNTFFNSGDSDAVLQL